MISGLYNRINDGDVTFPLAIAVVLCGSVMTSSSAIWIKFLPGLSAITISFIRVAGASLIFLPWFLRELRGSPIDWSHYRYSIAAGVSLAFHFASWILSLKYTTVAIAVLLVTTHPIFVIGISITLLKARVAPRQIAGSLVALAGVALIQFHELSASDNADLWETSLRGNLLALAGSFFAAIYFLFSQRARRQLSTLMHVEVTYATAAVCLGIAQLVMKTPPIPSEALPWLYLLLLVLLPTVGGHTIFNWGLRHLGAPLISLFCLLEPLQAGLLAYLLLDEVPANHTLWGGAVVISGLLLAVWRRADQHL